MPQWEAALPRGVKEEDLLSKRYETFTMDHDWVKWVRGSLLGLETGATPSKKNIDTSERFIPRAAVSELEPPEVVVDHWLPILREHGHLVTSLLLWQTGSPCTHWRAYGCIFWWLYPPL